MIHQNSVTYELRGAKAPCHLLKLLLQFAICDHFEEYLEVPIYFSMAKVCMSGKNMGCFPEISKNVKQSERSCLVKGKSRLWVSTVVPIVLAIVRMLSPLAASAQQWVLFCKGDQANEYYDSNSVKYLPDNKVQVLEKFVPTNVSGDTTILSGFQFCMLINSEYQNTKGKSSYGVNLYELNCKTNEMRTILKTFYDKDGNILCKFSTDKMLGWKKIGEKDCLRLLSKAVCK